MSTFCSQEVLTLASGIWESVNSPSAMSVAYVSGVLTSSGFLGAINTRLTTDFWVSGGACIAGCFGAEEQNIASLQFQHDYWQRLRSQALGSAGMMWTSLREGDSSVVRESPVKLASEYGKLAKDVQEELQIAVAGWKLGHTSPCDVEYAPPAAYPTP